MAPGARHQEEGGKQHADVLKVLEELNGIISGKGKDGDITERLRRRLIEGGLPNPVHLDHPKMIKLVLFADARFLTTFSNHIAHTLCSCADEVF